MRLKELVHVSKGLEEILKASGLSRMEFEILDLAYERGYFDEPKRTSISKLAEEYGMKHSKYHALLVRVTKKVVGKYLEQEVKN